MRQSPQILRRASFASSRRIAPSTPRCTALRRHASTYASESIAVPGFFDIFDVPARMIDDESTTFLPENFREQKHYIPSPFCPPSSLPSVQGNAVSSTKASASSSFASSSRALPYTPPMLLFDGPAHPSQPIVVTSRHRKSSSLASTSNASAYSPPDPIVFDGPARPRRRGQTMSKSEANSWKRALAAAATAVAGLVSYQLYKPQSVAKLPLRTAMH